MAIQHYEGELGKFDYDDKMFEFVEIANNGYPYDILHFKDNYVGPIRVPSGCNSFEGMFENCKIQKGCFIESIDFTQAKDAVLMFVSAEIPEGFTFPENIDTSNIEHMDAIFEYAKLPKGFELPEGFTVSKKHRDTFFNGATMGDKPVKVHFTKEGQIDVLRPMSEVELKALSEIKTEYGLVTDQVEIPNDDDKELTPAYRRMLDEKHNIDTVSGPVPNDNARELTCTYDPEDPHGL
mgnify:CR=1 FL=1